MESCILEGDDTFRARIHSLIQYIALDLSILQGGIDQEEGEYPIDDITLEKARSIIENCISTVYGEIGFARCRFNVLSMSPLKIADNALPKRVLRGSRSVRLIVSILEEHIDMFLSAISAVTEYDGRRLRIHMNGTCSHLPLLATHID